MPERLLERADVVAVLEGVDPGSPDSPSSAQTADRGRAMATPSFNWGLGPTIACGGLSGKEQRLPSCSLPLHQKRLGKFAIATDLE